MKKLLKSFFYRTFVIFQPLLEKTLLRNQNKISDYQRLERDIYSSSMVERFNWTHKFFLKLFRRVRIVKTDISRIKELSQKGPLVFIMKNRGQLEYRYFNHLFLKERIELVRYANNIFTVSWRPLKEIWRYLLARLSLFYSNQEAFQKKETEDLEQQLQKGKNVLINLSISRDYLFGLIRSNPLEKLKPLLDIQKNMDTPITIVPIQFLYDKQPEKLEKSFFDLLFGEKSQPGGIRKVLLFFMGLRRQPQAKFGEEISLKQFIQDHEQQEEKQTIKDLYKSIQNILSIELARITGPLLKSKENLIQEILSDSQFQNKIETLSEQNNLPQDSVYQKAKKYLNDISADVNYSIVHFFWLILNYLWNNIFDGLVIKHNQLNQIREVAGKHPVILVPMHRSHIDYLLISHIFYGNNITFPHICAGDNLNFWPVGKLIRKGGGFFIKRRFQGNDVYKETLYQYIKTLVNQGYCIEFFIEGTRSRTGKLLKPKMGILSQVIRAYLEGTQDDVYFVPIAVNYDQILEQKSYQSESSGAEKSKEKASELLKVRKVLNKKYGKVYIEFASPISLKNYLEEKQITKNTDIQNIKNEISDFAYHLTYNINRVVTVTPISLVSLAILSLNKKTFNFEELITRIKIYKEYLDYKQTTFSDLIHYSDRWAYSEAVQVLESRNYIKEVKTFEESFYILESQTRTHLDYYKNNILHFFVSLTCFCKILNNLENHQQLSLENALKKYEFLKQLFQNDFTFSSRISLEEHLKKVMEFCQNLGFISSENDFVSCTKNLTSQNEEMFLAYLNLLDNFLESHLIVLRYLNHNRFQDTEQKSLIKDILEKSRPLYLKEDLHYPEALSRFNIENSLKFCLDIGLIEQKTSQKGERSLYSSLAESDSIQKWILSVQSFLTSDQKSKINNDIKDLEILTKPASHEKELH